MVLGVRKILPEVRIHLVAREECKCLDIDEWIDISAVAKKPFASLQEIGRAKPDLIVILLNGRWIFWRQWLFGALLRGRGSLIFNKNGDAFFLCLKSLPRLILTLFRTQDLDPSKPSLPSRFQGILVRIAKFPMSCFRTMTRRLSVRTPAILHPVFGRSPEFHRIHHVICIGSGMPEEVEMMVLGIRKLLPETKIHMVAQPECKQLPVDEWIDIRIVERSPFAALRNLGRSRPDLVAVLMNGRWVFWRQWLFGSLLRARCSLIFNKNGDAFFLRLRSIPHLAQTLFRREGNGHRHGLISQILEFLSRIAGLPVLFFEAIAMQWSRKKLDPAFALSLPGEQAWRTPQDQDACYQTGASGDAKSTRDQTAPQRTLEFTGERFVPTPGLDPNLVIEHYSRYSFASSFAAGKSVLDAGCGEGYGVASLARVAQEAVGVDVSSEAIDNAKKRYRQPNLEFLHVDAAKDYPFPDQHFDVVTSFEVIEHIRNWNDYLQRINRVLAETGMLILSSPNRPYYRDERGEVNPYHHHEFDLEELDRTLAAHFPHRKMFGQNHYGGILIEDFQSDRVQVDSSGGLTGREIGNSHYLLAVCSRSPLPQMEGLCYPSIRGNQMRERERQIAFLQSELQKAKDAYEQLASEFEQRGLWALTMQREIEKLRCRLEDGGK